MIDYTSKHLIQLESEFAEFLDGKSVAIVARGPSMRTLDGKFIDSHDVVVRIHSCHFENWVPEAGLTPDWTPPPFVPEECQHAVGKRTDIYYNNFGQTDIDWIDKTIKAFRDEGGRFLCCETAFNVFVDPWLKMHMQESISTRWPNLELWAWLCNRLGIKRDYQAQLPSANPLEGTLALCDILQYNVKSVFVGGMTCWCDDANKGVRLDDDGNPNRYAPMKDFKFIFDLWTEHANFFVDSEMERLFEVKFDDYKPKSPTLSKFSRLRRNEGRHRYS